MNKERLANRLILHEGLRLKPYRDHLGFLTIGIGRCLDKKGISKKEAHYMLQNDIDDATQECIMNIDFFEKLDNIRQEVLVEMCFQLGITGLLGFREFLYQLGRGAYMKAAEEMLNSKWAKQDSPKRALELSQIMFGENDEARIKTSL